MAQKMTKGIDTSRLPTAAEFLALSKTPSAAGAVNALTEGLTSGIDIGDKLATRQLERQKLQQDLADKIRIAKESALQKTREQAIASEIGGTTPEATRVAASMGGTPVQMKETRQYQEAAPERLQTVLAAAEPKETAKDSLRTGRENQGSARDQAEAIELQNLKFKQAKELAGMKDKGKDKERNIPISLINEMDKINNQEQQISSLQNLLRPVNKKGKRESISSGATGLVKSAASFLTKGNVGGTDVRTYMQIRPALAVGYYRAATGDTRLSDADAAARALPLTPDPGEPESVQEAKITEMVKSLAIRKKSIESIADLVKQNRITPQQAEAIFSAPSALGSVPTVGDEIDPAMFVEED